MRHWVNDCVENHARCRENFRPYCPTRLLDLVRFWSSGDIVLVERVEHAEEYIPYTALSHCWGTPPSRPLITTLANLASRKERIPFDELPLTFKDAVTTTRKLKIPYLWIDSLCIIQDSPSDWEREAGKMALVYAGSICTLSALGAHNSHGGFFRLVEKERDFVYRYDLNLGSQRIRVFPCEPNDWLLDGPLMERAWTLQERELSNRILHFPRDELLWECKTLRASADLPWLKVSRTRNSFSPILWVSRGGKECFGRKRPESVKYNGCSNLPVPKSATKSQTNFVPNPSIELMIVTQHPSCYMTALKKLQARTTILLC